MTARIVRYYKPGGHWRVWQINADGRLQPLHSAATKEGAESWLAENPA